MTCETVKLDDTVDYGQHDQPRRIPTIATTSTFAGKPIGVKPTHVSVSLEFIRGARAALAHFGGTEAVLRDTIAAEVLRHEPKEADK